MGGRPHTHQGILGLAKRTKITGNSLRHAFREIIWPRRKLVAIGLLLPAMRSWRHHDAEGTLTVAHAEFIQRFYSPVWFVFDNCRPFADAINWYIDLWLP